MENSHTLLLQVAADSRRNVEAVIADLAPGDTDAGPGPVGTAAITTGNVDLGAIIILTCSDNILEDEVGDGNPGGRGLGGIVIVLLDDDAVVSGVGKGDLVIGDFADRASIAIDGLDTDR